MPEMRSEFRDTGANRAAAGLAIALRSNMPRAGWHKINPYVEDDYAEAEAEYRRETGLEPPVFGTAKFKVGNHWYLFDSARPHLRRALELDRPRGKRSAQAAYLAALLHADELHREHLAEAAPRAVGHPRANRTY